MQKSQTCYGLPAKSSENQRCVQLAAGDEQPATDTGSGALGAGADGGGLSETLKVRQPEGGRGE